MNRPLLPALTLGFTAGTATVQTQLGDKVRINGYSSFEYEYQLAEDAIGGGKGDPQGSFDADLFDIVINVQASDKLRMSADVTWEHGAAAQDGLGNADVEYAFPEYAASDALKFRAGKMFVPFGIYNEIHTAKTAFFAVKEPLSTNKPHKFGADDRFYPRWTTGLSVLGNVALISMQLDYHVHIGNGFQEETNPYEEDNNTQKALTGRIRLQPIDSLKIGGSYYSDALSACDTLGQLTAHRTLMSSISGHVEYQIKGFSMEFEFVTGSVTVYDEDAQVKSVLEGMLYYTIKERYTPFVRVESLDPDADIDDENATLMSLGVNVKIDDGYFFKIQVNSTGSGDNNTRFDGVGYQEIQAAVVLGF
jgi:hypothetical protein